MSIFQKDTGRDRPRRRKYSEVKSQCDSVGLLQSFVMSNRFPLRPTINMALIILITFQVYLVVTSHIYLRGSITRSFLQLYASDQDYPQLYDGLSFYLTVRNVSEIKKNLEYTFEQIRQVKDNSFLGIDLEHSKITLSVEYLNNLQTKETQQEFIIDPKIGIVQPFNMSEIEEIQKFLIKVNWFKLIVDNITVDQEGFYEKYYHEIVYDFEEGLEVTIDFKFLIDNAMFNEMTIDKPQANYILVIRGFHLVILFLAVLSSYLNYRYIRRTMKVMFYELTKTEMSSCDIQNSMINAEDMVEINEAVLKWIKINKLTLEMLTFKHYFYIIEFDIIFSMISNLLTIVGSFYLFIGLERQIIIGISCLTSWMTIFKFLRNKKKLVLMYELIKLSIIRVMFFFIEFFPVFLSYTLLGVCLFPKVSFYSSLAKSVTTLVSLMMGDSIEMITRAMCQKNSVALSVIYIFSFVLMFMHAIHNTLTSLIKEAFILKKIELIQEEKNAKQEKEFLYISELKCHADEEKAKLPIKLTASLRKDLMRIKVLNYSNQIEERIKKWTKNWEMVYFRQKWDLQEMSDQFLNKKYLQELQRRLKQVKIMQAKLSCNITIATDQSRLTIQKLSIMTDG